MDLDAPLIISRKRRREIERILREWQSDFENRLDKLKDEGVLEAESRL